ncbi:unnamed protein product [Diabrotica balteata]|uniref:Uncharacterized protein n=1 Tax=Diabrotica balteata TaxID=107213 RepID=A0A9N9SS42_DIABA|nr:unnamed protein product [Diabrotica balteata]
MHDGVLVPAPCPFNGPEETPVFGPPHYMGPHFNPHEAVIGPNYIRCRLIPEEPEPEPVPEPEPEPEQEPESELAPDYVRRPLNPNAPEFVPIQLSDIREGFRA